MSLPYLATFMDKKYQWKSIDLQGKSVVIKGDSLCYHLYFKNYMWQCGGNYYEFYSTVVEFFNLLNRLRINAFVVMNGGLTDENIHKERCVDRLHHITSIRTCRTSSIHESVLPLFAKMVFVDAMRDLNVDFTFADGDGDPVCVSLANNLDCPVLGHDADFFIFNIDGGYVPLYDTRGGLIDLGGKVRCYNYKAFDTQIGMTSHDQRLYLPLLLKRQTAVSSTRHVESVLETIQSERRYSGYVQREYSYGIGEQMAPIRSFYRVQAVAKTFGELVRHTKFSLINPRIPQWILTAFQVW